MSTFTERRLEDIHDFLGKNKIKLNDEQIDLMLALHGKDDIVGEAVPGSGKTTTVIASALYLMKSCGVHRNEILICSFNTASAELIRERFAKRTNSDPRHFIGLSRTYHSVGWEACRKMGRDELVTNVGEIIFNSADRYRKLFRELPPVDNRIFKNMITFMKNQGCHVLEKSSNDPHIFITERAVEELGLDRKILGQLLIAYELEKDYLVDHDDQLLIPYMEYLQGNNPFNAKPYNALKYLFVDELQDSNELQMKFIEAIKEVSGCKIIGIGDRDQALYAFRGAHTDNMDVFADRFKSKKYSISYNYRSGRKILSAASSIIKNNPGHEDYQLNAGIDMDGSVYSLLCSSAYSEPECVRQIIEHIKPQYQYRNIYILGRTNSVLSFTAAYLWKHGIPVICRAGDLEGQGVQLLNAVAAIVDHPNANLYETMRTVKFIGDKRAGEMTASGTSLDDIDVSCLGYGKIAGTVESFIANLKSTRSRFRVNENWKVDVEIFASIVKIARGMLEDISTEYSKSSAMSLKAEFETAAALLVSAARDKGPEASLDELYNMYDADLTQTKGSAVELMTSHRAKGQENDVVIVLDGNNFPCVMADENRDSFAQETNLLFVSVTRAKEKLFVSRYPKENMYGDTHESRLYDGIEWCHEFDMTKRNPRSETLPGGTVSLQDELKQVIDIQEVVDASGPWGRFAKKKASYPDKISEYDSGEEFLRFRDELVYYVKSNDPMLYLHQPSFKWKNVNPDKSSYQKFMHGVLYGDNPEKVLGDVYKDLMSKSIKPEDVRHRSQHNWLKSASMMVANQLGDGWRPGMYRRHSTMRYVHAQYDIVKPLPSKEKGISSKQAIVGSLIADVNGHPYIKGRLKMQVSLVQAHLNPDAASMSDIVEFNAFPLYGPMPVTLWESPDEYSKSVKKGEGFLPPSMLLAGLSDGIDRYIESLREIMEDIEDNISDFWGVSVGGHYWVHNPNDRLWPFHPEDVCLVEESNDVIKKDFDFASVSKEKAFYDTLREYNVPNPDVDLDRHVSNTNRALESLSRPAMEYIVSRDMGVSPSFVSSESSGKRIMFKVASTIGVKNPSPQLEDTMGKISGSPCSIRIG